MKKYIILLATALIFGLSSVGCNKAGKLSTPSTFTPPAGAIELKLKWPQGERIVQDTDMKMHMTMAIPGQPEPMKQEMTMGQQYGLTVLQENPDGSHELELDFLSARMGMTMGGRKLLDYDSAKHTSTDKPNPVADMFGKIVGSKIQVYLDASNTVDRVEGLEEMMNRVAASAPPAALAGLKGMFGEGYIKQMMSYGRFMPPKPVQPGDTWPVHFEYPMANLGTLAMGYNLTFVGWETRGERKCARMEFQGTINSKDAGSPNPSGMSISISDGNSSGVSWFDPELGITIDTVMNQDMNMVINMHMPGATGTQSITNQMNQDVEIKLISVK